ncbi:unnamed protein product [Moneuplotes crassus]|uniref:Glycoside hydrolase family 38 central domain-containing protein n=1 Tax=Euplotes crassus TaxID=5936 RepID=A0AAD1XKZ0_EUPCR|nr:unnamed protein product [Moneuplotes crassus]
MARKFWTHLARLVILLWSWCHLVVAYDPDTIDVHIVCHSHTDAGWYRTYDSYFTGYVIPILNSTIDKVHSGKNYKYNWADTSFLAKWYREIASEEHKKKLHELVKQGKWQFMGSGWVMSDESLTVYKNVMLQLQTGIKFVEETFGVRPKIGYQIDPFGNSAVTPSILSVLGYEGIVLSRIGTTFDWDLEASENSEFIWEGSNFDNKSDGKPILAHHLVRSKYQAPAEFKLQESSFPSWIHPKAACKDKEELNENYKECIKLYWDEVIHPSLTGHRHNQVLSIFGEDFAFKNAHYSFDYIDEFIKVVKEHFQEVTGKKINIFYSTFNEYFDAVKNFNNGDIKFPVYKGDFLPYVQLEDGNFDHWVGYYSSTPSLKQMIRHLFQRLRSLKLENLLSFLKDDSVKTSHEEIQKIQEDTCIFLHHDSITSTSPSPTLVDYAHRIENIEKKIDKIENDLLNTFTKKSISKDSSKASSALKGTKLLTIFNPLGYTRKELANFTTSTEYVQLYDSEGKVVEKAEIYLEYLTQYTNSSINTTERQFVVIFEAEFQPFSMTKYFYKELDDSAQCQNKCVKVISTQSPNGGTDMKIENSHIEIGIKRGQLISSYKDKWSGITVDLPTTIHTYSGTKGETQSGLYIFNPTRNSTQRELRLQMRNLQQGKLVTIIHSFYKLTGTNTLIAQSITLNNCSNFALQRSVRVATKMYSEELYEFTMRSDLSKTFGSDKTQIYSHNGADNQLKQFYTYEEAKKFNLTQNEMEYVGLNGFASIYGTTFRSENDIFFGFVNSNSILVNPLTKSHYEIMLMRNTNYYDDKGKYSCCSLLGIVDPLIDKNMETFDQILFAVQGIESFDNVQKQLSAVLNEKLQVRKTEVKYEDNMDTTPDSIFVGSGLSAGFGDIDIIDVSFDTGLKPSANWKLRSSMPFNVSLHPSFRIDSYGNKGIEINTNKPFLIDPSADSPLKEKRSPYTDLRDLFTDDMSFPIFNDKNKKDYTYGYVDVTTSLRNLKSVPIKEKVEYVALKDLKGKFYGDHKNSEDPAVLVSEVPCSKDGKYPSVSPEDPKAPLHPFKEHRDPTDWDEDKTKEEYYPGGCNTCDNKDISISPFIWSFVKVLAVAFLLCNLALCGILFYIKRLRKNQIHKYVMY